MGDLYPTPTRLDLLRAVRDGRVVFAEAPGTGIRRQPVATLVGDGMQFVRRVAAAVAELQSAGWVRRPDRDETWRLTAAGEKVLADG